MPLVRLAWLLALLALLAWGACAREDPPPAAAPHRPVRVESLQLEQRPVLLRYIGATGSQSIKKYSFKVAGRLQAIHVEKGQAIRRGQRLAQLDPRDLRFALEAAQLTLRKAEEAARDARSVHDRIEALYQQQARSQLERDKVRLNLEVAEASLRQAQVDVAYRESVVEDTWLRSEVDGHVLEVLSKPGEVVGAGYPVVVVRNDVQVVKVGLAQRDLAAVQPGTRARVDIDGAQGEGQVSLIAQIPDPRSRTYEVEVELTGPLAERRFYLGAIARVDFEVGQREGLWVPIQAVLTDGVDHVFVAVEGRAVRRNLHLGAISGTRVQVEGLRPGEQLIVEGMKNLKDGYEVAVLAGPASRPADSSS